MDGTDGSRGYRISDADRERAAQRLQTAMAEGRITMTELDDRLAVVYAARYADELAAPLADLPAPAAASAAPAVREPGAQPVVLRSGMGDIKRRGQWSVPARLEVRSSMGSAVLDFSETEVPHDVVDIAVHLGAGSARILLPEGATADVDDCSASMGSVTLKVSSIPRAGMPHFRVRGNAGMGSVTVRHPYRFAGFTF